MDAAEDGYAGRGKKEVLMLTRERIKLERVLGGISGMTKAPSAIWIVDTNKEHIAVSEAQKLRIPVVAVLDTNCDPDVVSYPIPGNDDAIRSVKLLTHVVGQAVVDGKQQREERQLAAARDAAGDSDAKLQTDAVTAEQAASSSEASAGQATKSDGQPAETKSAETKPVEEKQAQAADADATGTEDSAASPAQTSGTESQAEPQADA